MSLSVSTIISIARIFATMGIFYFHYLGLLGRNNHGIDLVCLLVFCFLSGYLSSAIQIQPLNWVYKRICMIMIPYWFIIVPVLIINRIVQYKETTLLSDFITMLGGNLFLNNPVYVIGWYVTFIIMLYLFVFIKCLSRNITVEVIIWIFGCICFGVLLHKTYYFISFALGCFVAKAFPLPKRNFLQMNALDSVLFFIQEKCYNFFLVHGGVLLFVYVVLGITDSNMFYLGVLLSGVGSLLLGKITNPLAVGIVNKVWCRTPNWLRFVGVVEQK